MSQYSANDVIGTVSITSINTKKTQVNYSVRYDKEHDIEFNYKINQIFDEDNLKINYTVRRERKLDLNINYNIKQIFKTEELETTYNVRHDAEELLAIYFVQNPTNTMYGKIDVFESPIHKHYGNLIKDTYVSTWEPDRNFGLENNIVFERGNTTLLEWQHEPIDDSLYNVQYEIGAFLSINIRRALTEHTKGTVYLIQDDWFEYTVTQNDNTRLRKYKEFTVPRNHVGYFDVPLDDLLEDQPKDEYFNTTLAVTFDNTTQTTSYSKEGNAHLAPELYHSYYVYPPNPTVNAQAIGFNVKQNNTDNLQIDYTVDSDYRQSIQEIKYFVPRDIESNTLEINFSSMRGDHILKEVGYNVPGTKVINNLDIDYTVKRESTNELSFNYNTPRTFDESNLEIGYKVRQNNQDNLSFNYNTPRTFGDSDIKFDYTVRQINQKDIEFNYNTPLMFDIHMIETTYTVKQDNKEDIKLKYNTPKYDKEDLLNINYTAKLEKVKSVNINYNVKGNSEDNLLELNMYTLAKKQSNLESNYTVDFEETLKRQEFSYSAVARGDNLLQIKYDVRIDADKGYVFII